MFFRTVKTVTPLLKDALYPTYLMPMLQPIQDLLCEQSMCPMFQSLSSINEKSRLNFVRLLITILEACIRWYRTVQEVLSKLTEFLFDQYCSG